MSTCNASNHTRIKKNPSDASNASTGATSRETAKKQQTHAAPVPKTTAQLAADHSKLIIVSHAKLISTPAQTETAQNTSNGKQPSM